MSMLPPFDPNQVPPGPELDPTGRARPDPDVVFLSRAEANPEDRVTFLDTMAIFGAIGCAQFLRLLIIFAAVGIIVLAIFIGSHV